MEREITHYMPQKASVVESSAICLDPVLEAHRTTRRLCKYLELIVCKCTTLKVAHLLYIASVMSFGANMHQLHCAITER